MVVVGGGLAMLHCKDQHIVWLCRINEMKHNDNVSERVMLSPSKCSYGVVDLNLFGIIMG